MVNWSVVRAIEVEITITIVGRCNNVVDVQTTLYQRQNDVMSVLGRMFHVLYPPCFFISLLTGTQVHKTSLIRLYDVFFTFWNVYRTSQKRLVFTG